MQHYFGQILTKRTQAADYSTPKGLNEWCAEYNEK